MFLFLTDFRFTATKVAIESVMVQPRKICRVPDVLVEECNINNPKQPRIVIGIFNHALTILRSSNESVSFSNLSIAGKYSPEENSNIKNDRKETTGNSCVGFVEIAHDKTANVAIHSTIKITNFTFFVDTLSYTKYPIKLAAIKEAKTSPSGGL